MSENVCITSLSEGRWFNTNIWETRGSYFEIDGKDYSIKCSVDPKDPKITGKTVKRLISKVPEKVPLKKSAGNGGTKKERDELVEDTVSLDDKIRTVVSPITVPRELLSTDENFIFNEILRENNCCVPFAILRGIQHNPKAREHIYRIFLRELEVTFKVKLRMENIARIPIQHPSSLIRYLGETVEYIWYKDLSIRFDTLGDQRRWWYHLRHKIQKDAEMASLRYVEYKDGKFNEYEHIDYDVYREGVSIPMKIRYDIVNGGEEGVCILCPSFCYTRQSEEEVLKPLKYQFSITKEPTLATFSDVQLKNVLKLEFPGVNITLMGKCTNNTLSVKRTRCLFEMLKHGHKCNDVTSSSFKFVTCFERNDTTQDAVCKIVYNCACVSELNEYSKGYDVGCIYATTRNSTDDEYDSTVYNPVTLDEDVEFPEELDFNETLLNTDVGFSDLFVHLYKDRYVYNPEDERFHYYDGELWIQDDKADGFTENIISKKLSACMDADMNEIKEELEREYAQQNQNKTAIARLTRKLTKCDVQRKRLTDGSSKVKKFIKTRIQDKHFNEKSKHIGKIAASNGLVDLKNGKIRMFKPSDYIQEKCKFAYYKCTCKPGTCLERDEYGNIKCDSIIRDSMQRQDDYIRQIFGCDCLNPDGTFKYGPKGENLYWHFIRMMGYANTGEGNRKWFFYCHSPQNSGKTLALDTPTEVLSPYFGTIPKGLLFGKKGPNTPTPEVVMVLNKRAGFTDEVSKDDKFDDRNTKAVTGRSKMEYRKMGQEYNSTRFRLVPFIAANQYNEMDCLDPAFWDRLMPVIFPMRFAREVADPNTKIGNVRLRDDKVADLFETEEFQIASMNNLIRYSIYYYAHINDPIPVEIAQKISELRKESFALDEFVNNTEKYEFDKDASVPIKVLYDDFKRFVQDNNIRSKINYSLSQFRSMINEMAVDESYDKKICIDTSKNRLAQLNVKGIRLIESRVSVDYSQDVNVNDLVSTTNPRKRVESDHYDPLNDPDANQDNRLNKKTKTVFFDIDNGEVEAMNEDEFEGEGEEDEDERNSESGEGGDDGEGVDGNNNGENNNDNNGGDGDAGGSGDAGGDRGGRVV